MTGNVFGDAAQATSTIEAMMKARRWLISFNKRPHWIDGTLRTGPQNSPEDLARLAAYDEAVAECARRGDGWELGFALGFDGVGYWQGIDLDKVVANGRQATANALPGYVEYSRSKLGVHAIGYGRAFTNLGNNGSGIEAYSTSQHFVTTQYVVNDAPLTDLSIFVEIELAPLHKRGPNASNVGPATPEITADIIADVRTAITYLDGHGRYDWIAQAHALKTMGPPGYGLYLEYSKRSSKFDQADADRVWNSLNPTNTSYKAILAKAQEAGWINPRSRASVGNSLSWPFGEFTFTPGVIPAGGSRYRRLNGDDLDTLPWPEWRLKGILPAKGVAVIYGPSTGAKSSLCWHLGAAIAEGEDFFAHGTVRTHVEYLSLEGHSGSRARKTAWELRNGRKLPANFHVILDNFSLKNDGEIAELISVLPKECVLFIDTFSRAGDDDINDTKSRWLLIQKVTYIQQQIGGLVVLIAHTGKDEGKGISGAKNLFDNLDAVIYVTRDGDARRWTLEKNKDGKDGIGYGFRLECFAVGIDPHGDEVTSCVIAPDTRPISTIKPMSKAQVDGLQAYREAASGVGKLDAEGNFFGLTAAEWRAAFYFRSTAENDNAKKAAFQRARDALIAAGEIGVADGVYRLAGPNAVASNLAIAAQIKGVTEVRNGYIANTCIPP